LIDKAIEQKIQKVSEILKNKKVIVAFSGGVDSTLILLFSIKFSANVIPVFFNGPIFSNEDFEIANHLCKLLKIQLEVLDVNPLEVMEFKDNPPDRCYYCKKYTMSALSGIQKEYNYDMVIEGTNATEIKGHRPGFKALKELDIESPLLVAEFTKDEIRKTIGYIKDNIKAFLGESVDSIDLHKILNFIQNRPSNPCLCSRIEYNIPIEMNTLKMIEKAESFLKSTFKIEIVRVRYHNVLLARIEIEKDKLPILLIQDNIKKITDYFKSIGFKYITFDLEGFRSGSFN
jgi:uncharacterized protein